MAKPELRKPQIQLNRNNPSYHSVRGFSGNLGSPVRLQKHKKPVTKGENNKLVEHYEELIEKKERELLNSINQINEYTHKLEHLYTSKLQINNENAVLSEENDKLERRWKSLQMELEYKESALSDSLKTEYDQLVLQVRKRELDFARELDEVKLHFQREINELQEFDTKDITNEIEELKKIRSQLKEQLQQEERVCETVFTEKSAKSQEAFQMEHQRLQENLDALKDKTTNAQLQLEQQRNMLADIKKKSHTRKEKLEVMQQQLESLQESKELTSSTVEQYKSERSSWIEKSIDLQRELDIWEAKFAQSQAVTQTLEQKLVKEKFLQTKTEFNVQSLIGKYKVYAEVSHDVPVINGNGFNKIAVANESFRISKVIQKDDKFFVGLLDGLFKNINSSITLLSRSKTLGAFVKEVAGSVDSYYREELVDRGWNLEFKLQFLQVSWTQNKYKDILESESPTLVIGRRDIKAESRTISFSEIENETFAALDSQVLPGYVPFVLLHLQGFNTDLDKRIDSTCFIFDFSNVDRSELSIFYDEIFSQLQSSNYSTKVFKDEIFIKQLVHCVYGNTDSITLVNDETDLLKIGHKMNQIKVPPKNRFSRAAQS